MLEIAFAPDRSSDAPLSQQLAEHLAALIEGGRIPAGERLPATRDVASQLGLARNTIAAAYDSLTARGLTEGQVGRGTFVVARGGAQRAASGLTALAAVEPREFGWAGLFSRTAKAAVPPRALRLSELGGPFRFDFRGGRVDGGSVPGADLRWAFARPFHSRAALAAIAALQDPYGWPALRREVAARLTERGIACSAEDVAITNGLQQAIDLAARALVDPGDAVALEQPGYFGAALAFRGRGADLLGVEVDDEGLRTDRLARLLRVRRVKLIYVTPAAQSPTGVRLSPARREALLALADEHQVPVFEDDYDSELRWDTPPLAALKARDRAGQIVYAGTFSKALFPGLRVGYVVAARPLLERLVTLRAFADFGTGVVEQAALATLLATRGLERHLQRVRRLYRARRGALLAALAREMPAGVRWSTPQGGHLVWVTLPPGADPERVQAAARARGVAYASGEIFFADGGGAAHLALAFTALDEAAIVQGVRQLGAAVAESCRLRRRAARAPRGPRAAAPRGIARAGAAVRRRSDAKD